MTNPKVDFDCSGISAGRQIGFESETITFRNCKFRKPSLTFKLIDLIHLAHSLLSVYSEFRLQSEDLSK